MPRRRHNNLTGTLGAQLTAAATSITFAAALQEAGSNIATIASPEYLVLKIENEIVWLTAYTAGATTGTVERGREGTTDATHVNGTAVRHVMTDYDFPISTVTPRATDFANHDLATDQCEIAVGNFPIRGKDAALTVEGSAHAEGNAVLIGILYVGQPSTPGTRLYDDDATPVSAVGYDFGEVMVDGMGFFRRRIQLSGLDITKEVTYQSLLGIVGGSQSYSTLPASSGPTGIGITPDGSKIYVPGFNTGDVSIIRAGGRPYAYALDGSYGDYIETDINTGVWPLAVACTNTKAVVCNYNSTSITVINVADNSIQGTYSMPSSRNPRSVCISPDGVTAYIGTQQGNLDRMTIATGSFGGTLAVVASQNDGVAITPDGTKLYSGHANGNVYRVTVSSFTTAATITAGGAVKAVHTVDNSKVWVCVQTIDKLRSYSQSTDALVDDWALPYTTAASQGVAGIAIVKGGVTGAPATAETAFLAFGQGRWCQFYIAGPFAGTAHGTHRGQLVTSTGALYSGDVSGVAVNDLGEIWWVLGAASEVLKMPGARAQCRPTSGIHGEFFDVTVEV